MKSYQVTVLPGTRGRTELGITAVGGLGTLVEFYPRPGYTQHEAQQVVGWLNGRDQPVKMVPRHMDDWDPAIRFPLKKPVRRI